MTAKLGFFSNPRADDNAVISTFTVRKPGTPYPNTDPDYLLKNALYRVELQVGKQFELHRIYHALDDTSVPTAYDIWSAGEGRVLLLSLKSRTLSGGVAIPYGDVAAGLYNTQIDAIADGFVAHSDVLTDRLWPCYNHEPSLDEAYQTKTGGNRAAGSVTVPVTALPIAIPAGFNLVWKNGATGVASGDAAGATTVHINAPGITSNVVTNEVLPLQTTAASNADFAAAWRLIHTRMNARPGFAALNAKWTLINLQAANQFGAGQEADQRWPGDSYVDYCGWDGAYILPPNLLDPSKDFNDAYFNKSGNSFLLWARGKGKPVVIGEFGINEDTGAPSDCGTAIDNIKTDLKSYDDLAGVCYFTGAANGWYLDTAPQGSANKLAHFITLAFDPFFHPFLNVITLDTPNLVVRPGDRVSITATLEAPAPQDTPLTITSSNSDVQVPTNITILQGLLSVEFTINVSSDASDGEVVLTVESG